MKISKVFAVFAAVVSASVSLTADGGYSVTDILKKENEQRLAAADREFYYAPRESTAFLEVSGMRLFNMGADTKGSTGWAGSLSAVFQKNADDTPDWKLLVGGEIFAAYAWRHGGNGYRHFETLNLSLVAGTAYDFTRKFSAGILFGYSPIGVSSRAERHHYHAAWSSVYSVRPYVEYNFNPNSAVYLGYRFFYLNSWTHVESHADALEIGWRLRF